MNDDQNPTEATTAPEAVTTTEQPETFDREYVEKLRKENATYRTKAKAAEEAAEAAKTAAERAKLDDIERLQAEKNDAEKALAAERAARTTAERRAAITGRVADATAALKLLDPEKHLKDDQVDVDALLADYPFLAPQTPGSVSIPGARTSKTPALTPADMSKEDFEALQKRVMSGERITL